MEKKPETSQAIPEVRIVVVSVGAPATPTTIPATDTIPAFAPRTPARSQFSFPPTPWCGSWACCTAVSVTGQVKHEPGTMARCEFSVWFVFLLFVLFLLVLCGLFAFL